MSAGLSSQRGGNIISYIAHTIVEAQFWLLLEGEVGTRDREAEEEILLETLCTRDCTKPVMDFCLFLSGFANTSNLRLVHINLTAIHYYFPRALCPTQSKRRSANLIASWRP